MRTFLRRLNVLPFEVLIAQLVVVSGGLALFHVGGIGQDVLSTLLPGWLTTTLNALYLLTGLAMFVGIGMGRSDIEVAGLIGVASGAVIRGLALAWFAWDAPGVRSLILVGFIFDVFIVVACAIRLTHLFQRKSVILAELRDRVDRRATPR